MLAETQTELYFERMSSSIGDKSQLLKYAVGEDLLDFGCGGGDLSAAFMEAGFNVVGVEGSEQAKRAALSKFPLLTFAESSDVKELINEFGVNSFDTIVCCSVLHEVFSYGEDETPSYAFHEEVLNIFKKLLRPGGRLLIRDGVKPKPTDNVEVKVLNPSVWQFWDKYFKFSPFNGNQVSLTRHEDSFVGDSASVMEFIYTLTWGLDSVEREAQELYGVFTLDDYVKKLQKVGFTTVHQSEYFQLGYHQNLNHLIEVDVYPATNMILVMKKTD